VSADPLRTLARFDPLDASGPALGGVGRPYLLLDVFSDTVLAGNPLAVVCDGRGLGAEKMQQIARELNLSETVFGLPGADARSLRVRIFTPHTEMQFAGHPVLGFAVAAGGALGREKIVIETGAGPVEVVLRPLERGRGHGRMGQPVPTWTAFAHERELLQALGASGSRLPVEIYTNGPRHVYVGFEDSEQVASLSPDMNALAALGELCFSCFAGSGLSWKTRMFAPALGVPEDPATGSAAGPLAVHLCRHGLVRFGDEIEVHQGAEVGRPSLLRARATGARERVEAVEVAGDAVFAARGQLLIDE
jgi:trans-2,3-dihydro-3-hydroxyanthranilate isomerase